MRTVTLHKETHQYFDELGQRYVSVSSLLKKLFPFDALEVATKVSAMPSSKYFGRTTDDIIAEWNGRRNIGTELHEAIEAAILGKDCKPELRRFTRAFKAGNWRGPLKSEVVLHDPELFIAGTTDLIEERPAEDVIWDIKTCRKIDEEKLLQYSAQITLYARFNQGLTGRPTRPGGILFYQNFPECQPKPMILRPINCEAIVSRILADRRAELAMRKPGEICNGLNSVPC